MQRPGAGLRGWPPGLVRAGRAGDQVEELAVPRHVGQDGAVQRGQRRVVRLQYRELGDIGTIYHAEESAIAQVRGK